MGMSFSIHLVPDDVRVVAERSKYAEDNGFEQVWIAESHLTCRDHNIALALAIEKTSHVKIGPGVTNPVLHDDSVAASAIATLDELSGGRVLFGIGSGDTPVYTLGKKMARLARMRESIAAIRRVHARRDGGIRRGREREHVVCARNTHIHLRRRPQDAGHVR